MRLGCRRVGRGNQRRKLGDIAQLLTQPNQRYTNHLWYNSRPTTMKWTDHLCEQGYDLINGPIRSHQIRQIWLKNWNSEPQLYYQDIDHAFNSIVPLSIKKDPTLELNTTSDDEYGFNIGITFLDQILESIGLGSLKLSAVFNSGKKISIKYENAESQSIPIGEITNYLTTADFKHPNPVLLRNLNRNDLLVITGIITASQIQIEMETDVKIKPEIITKLNKMASGNIEFTRSKENKIKMSSSGKSIFPVAVQAHRIDYSKGIFRGLQLITDGDVF